jgi:anti-anti-sigma factor
VVERRGDAAGAVLAVRGELDLDTVDSVRTDLTAQLQALAAGDRLTLDLRTTTYLPSAGVGLLLEALERAQARGVELRLLTEPGSLPARVLALAGLASDPDPDPDPGADPARGPDPDGVDQGLDVAPGDPRATSSP